MKPRLMLESWNRHGLGVGRPRMERAIRSGHLSTPPVTRPVGSDSVRVRPEVQCLAQPTAAGPVVEAIETATRR